MIITHLTYCSAMSHFDQETPQPPPHAMRRRLNVGERRRQGIGLTAKFVAKGPFWEYDSSMAFVINLDSLQNASSGAFDDDDIHRIRQIFSKAWRLLCDRNICSEGSPAAFQQREQLARVAFEVFSGGERDICQAAQRCFESFSKLVCKY